MDRPIAARRRKRRVTGSSEESPDSNLPGPLRAWRLRRRGDDQDHDHGRQALPVSPRSASRDPGRIGHPLEAGILIDSGPPEAELARIREICGELGADAEMTFLVLTSHCRDRIPLDVMLSEGSDLSDYVRHRLAIWEAILGTDEGPPPDRSAELG